MNKKNRIYFLILYFIIVLQKHFLENNLSIIKIFLFFFLFFIKLTTLTHFTTIYTNLKLTHSVTTSWNNSGKGERKNSHHFDLLNALSIFRINRLFKFYSLYRNCFSCIQIFFYQYLNNFFYKDGIFFNIDYLFFLNLIECFIFQNLYYLYFFLTFF